VCFRVVETQYLQAHLNTKDHRVAAAKQMKLKRLSIQMWEAHRGAPAVCESAHEGSIEREFAAFKASQQLREPR
jgi:hypothetical protein